MPRRLRVFIEGGIYHVYNRVVAYTGWGVMDKLNDTPGGDRQRRGFFSRLKIRHKLLLSYSALLLVVALLGNALVYVLVRNTLRSDIEGQLDTSTIAITEMVHSSAQAAVGPPRGPPPGVALEVAGFFHQQAQLGLMTDEEARRQAEEMMLRLRIGESGYLYCVNSRGILDVHPKKALRLADLSAYGFIQDQIERKEGYLEYDWQNPDDATDRPKALYMKYFEPWDWIISASSYRTEFATLIEVDDFRQNILNLRFGETGYPYVIDGSGNIVIHPNLVGNVYDIQDSNGRAFIREICAAQNGKTIYTWQNPGETGYREKFAVFRYLPEFDWIVVATSYSDEFFAPLEQVRRAFLATAFITLMLLVPLTIAVSSSITRPIERLVRQLKLGADGDFSVRAEHRSGDEIGRLARYFNLFMSHLEEGVAERERMEQEQSRLAERLRQSEKMEAVGQLAGGVAHDFNNILAAVIGHADLILASSPSPENRRWAEQIITAADRATSLTRTLLDFSRKSAVHAADIDVCAMINEVIGLLEHSIDKQITIEFASRDEPLFVRGDGGRLQNTFLNLALNARDAMPDGGRLRFAARRCGDEDELAVTLGDSQHGYLEIAVADTGAGMDAETLGRIFEPFFTTKSPGKGTGLGLTSAYGCVRGHNGAIEVHSTPNEGTTVKVTLPMVRPERRLPRISEQTVVLSESGYVLVVDDEDAIRAFAEEMLQDFGFTTIGCRDGLEAVEVFSERHGEIRLVLLDLVMPRLNGKQTLARLLEIDPTAVVVLCSGYPGDTGVGSDLPEGAAAFLAKPYRLDELSRVVTNVLV